MNISKTCSFFLRDLYSYDISSCHYNILKKFGFDLSHINKDDKLKRNTQIGLMMRDNSRISSLLRSTTESVINEFLFANNVTPEDIITRQYDGIILTKFISESSEFLPLELKSIIQIFILSIDRTRYIAYDGNEYLIKGISNRYQGIDEIYKKILSINYSNKSSIFNCLQTIRDEIFQSNDGYLYAIPSEEKKFNLIFKNYGQMEVSKSVVNILDCSDIDRDWYWKRYIEPFTKSIIFEVLKGNER